MYFNFDIYYYLSYHNFKYLRVILYFIFIFFHESELQYNSSNHFSQIFIKLKSIVICIKKKLLEILSYIIY